MSIDQAQVNAAVAAVSDPELRRPLGELGMVGRVEFGRRRVTVEVALPVAHYPGVDELAARVRQAVGPLAGVDQVLVETRNLIAAVRQDPKKYLTIHLKLF